MINMLLLALFPLAMAFAAASDMLTMRISNKLVLAMLIGFALLSLISGMALPQVGIHIATGLVTLVLSFSLFALGWIGGGDAKFAAATALWLGWPLVLPFLVYAALFGGVLTVLILALRYFPLPAGLAKITWIDRLHDAKQGVPYGMALAAAGLMTYSQSGFFHFFVG